MTDERLLATKRRAAEQFFKIPGVTGVGLGGRERGGTRTGEFVIKAFVAEKRPPGELTPGRLLPSRFEGIGVDVDELGPIGLEAGPPAPGDEPVASGPTTVEDMDDQHLRPMYSGLRIQPRIDDVIAYGSIGGFWQDTDHPEKVYILTNFHVLSADGRVTPVPNVTRVGQSTKRDGPSKCCNRLVGTFVAGSRTPTRDAVLIQLDPGVTYLPEVFQIGPIAGVHDIDPVTEIGPGKPYFVKKYGARTRLTGGHVTSVNTQLKDEKGNVQFESGMVIRPNPNKELGKDVRPFFADEGDSGTLIINADRKVVGLHVGGVNVGKPGQSPFEHIGWALSISSIIKQFSMIDKINIAVVTSTIVNDKRTVPGTPKSVSRNGIRPMDGYAAGVERVDADLVASTAGRQLRALWTDHLAELLDLVEHRRRVTVAWHRGGGPALMQMLFRMASDPDVPMPATLNGVPPMDRIAGLHAVFHANASPELRRALDQALTVVPDPASLTYDQLLAAIASR